MTRLPDWWEGFVTGAALVAAWWGCWFASPKRDEASSLDALADTHRRAAEAMHGFVEDAPQPEHVRIVEPCPPPYDQDAT